MVFLPASRSSPLCSPSTIRKPWAAKQRHRSNIVITSVDDAPDIETALGSNTLVHASASQDPWKMAQTAVQVDYDTKKDKKPAIQ